MSKRKGLPCKTNGIQPCNPSPLDIQACRKGTGNQRQNCDITAKENDQFRKRQEALHEIRERRTRKGLSRRAARRGQRGIDQAREEQPPKVRDKTWKDGHCQHLLLPLPRLVTVNGELKKGRLKELEDQANTFMDDVQNLVRELLVEEGIEIAFEKGVRYGARTGGRHAGAALCGPPLVFLCEAAMVIVDVVDGVITFYESREDILQAYRELIEKNLGPLIKARDDAQKLLKAAHGEIPAGPVIDDITDAMTDAVQENPCLKARRCILIPYQDHRGSRWNPAQKDAKGKPKPTDLDQALGLDNPAGCCPGQTAHHLVPHSWVAHCKGSSKRKGLTVCVEGPTQYYGTHRKIHEATDAWLDLALKVSGEMKGHCDGGFDMDCSIQVVAKAHSETVGDHCDLDCTRAQLQAHFDGMNCRPKPVFISDRKGRPTPSRGRQEQGGILNAGD